MDQKLWRIHSLPPQLTFARATSLFENTIGNWFFDFFLILSETLQKKFGIEIVTFSFQICFQNQFLTLGGGQTENTQIRVDIDYGFFRVFGPYFLGKLLGTFQILIFGLWSYIPPPWNLRKSRVGRQKGITGTNS